MSVAAPEPIVIRDERFARFERVEWWDQKRLRDARVLVIGAGAIGNEVIKNLALLGVGHLVIADMDSIELSNLSRSVLFRESDAGKSKAECAARGARDNREARIFTNSACARVGKPWIDGGIEVLQGVARGFAPPATACYECTMSEVDWRIVNTRRSCSMLARRALALGGMPTTPTTASVIGAIEAQ